MQPWAGCLGIDVLPAADGGLRVLEVNDRPGGLHLVPDVAEPLARLLRTRPDRAGGRVVVVLPVWFALRGGPVAGAVAPADVADLRDPLVRTMVHDLTTVVASCPVAVQVVDARGAAAVVGELDDADVVWDRSGTLLADDTPARLVNAPVVRRICQDKVRTAEVLERAGVPHVPMLHPAAEPPAGARWTVVKPRRGGASEGVERVLVEGRLPVVDAGAVCLQEWVEPMSVQLGGEPHYADLRVFVLAGVPVASLLRIAAMSTRHAAQYAAGWLSTTGPVVPAVEHLPPDVLSRAQDLARSAADAVDAAARHDSQPVERVVIPDEGDGPVVVLGAA